MHKKVAIIGTAGLPAKYGGFESLAEYLTKELAKSFDITVYCSGKHVRNSPKIHNDASLKYIPIQANGMQSIFYDIVSMLHALFFADIFLILGVSGCVLLPFLRFFTNKRLIVNIDGLEWKRDKWGKLAKWFLKYSETVAVKYADVVIADNKVIQDYVHEAYGKKSELIEYGADHVNKIAIEKDLLETYTFLKEKYAFSVCRIEPENNLHLIIEAMAQQNKIPLVIVGNWHASQYGIDLKSKYADKDHVFLLDPIYEQNKLNQLRSNCTIYLHGHSAGGTNPSLVEAMHLELPIFAFDVAYNRETTEQQAKYFSSSKELLELVENSNESFLQAIGNKMIKISEKRYRWDLIAAQYSKLF